MENMKTLEIRDMKEITALQVSNKKYIRLNKNDNGIFFVYDDTDGTCSVILHRYHTKELKGSIKDTLTAFDQVRDIIFNEKRMTAKK